MRKETNTPIDTPGRGLLTTREWHARAAAHLERAHRWTLPHRERRSRQEKHPVYDFLFEYYMYSAARLEAWHPAHGESLVDSPGARERFAPPHYRAVGGVIQRDPETLHRRRQLDEARRVLIATQTRPANFGCYGLHEWAMVYQGHDVRHDGVAQLRLTQTEVDALVESRPVACSHFDAFRFFAPNARPLNRVHVDWSARHEMEQPGCVHANMDLYRWAYAAMPWIGSDLLMDCFELAVELRVLDMQASPWDLRDLGFAPIRIETTEGRTEYRHRQSLLSASAQALRTKLTQALDTVLSAGRPLDRPAATPTSS